MIFDTNCKNVAPMYLATVVKGKIEYRRTSMEKPYANVNSSPIGYSGPAIADAAAGPAKVIVFGSHASEAVATPEIAALLQKQSVTNLTLLPISSDGAWGKSSTQLVDAIYKEHAVGIIALDRNSSHLAEQLAIKAFIPVIAISDDKTLTSVNIPWIFRLPADSKAVTAIEMFKSSIAKVGANAERIRIELSSGQSVAGVKFQSSGEPQ
jgi:hypothetical protein